MLEICAAADVSQVGRILLASTERSMDLVSSFKVGVLSNSCFVRFFEIENGPS